MKTQWTPEQANEWYAKLPWLRGCNFISSDCCSRIDMWQSYGREARMQNVRREMKLCQDIGFNTIRLIMEFDVWYQERESYMDVLEEYISIAAEYGQSVMLCLTHEAVICREEKYVFKPLGEQAYALGYHQGRWPLSAEEKARTPYHALEREETREDYLEMLREIVGKYAQDPRVICWNVYNEPSIAIGERAIPLLDLVFKTVREMDPMQPLAADCWHSADPLKPMNPVSKHSLELSDVISYHSYAPIEKMIPQIEAIKKYNRPILMTEWLNRINHSDVREIYPLLYLENIGNYCWGFVVGKTQTHEPWESLWAQYYENPNGVNYDFTKWQHDLFRPNLRPYDPKEIELIQEYNKRADMRWNSGKE